MSQSDLPSFCLEKSSRVELAVLPQLPLHGRGWGGWGAAAGGSAQWYPAFHLLQVVAKERLLQITAAPSPTCSHAGSKGSALSPWLHRPGSTRCCRIVWKFFLSLSPPPQSLLKSSRAEAPAASPGEPPSPASASPYRVFPSGSLPHLLFHSVVKHIMIQTQMLCAWICRGKVRIHAASSLLSTNLLLYKSCDLDLIIHMCLEGNGKACLWLCS